MTFVEALLEMFATLIGGIGVGWLVVAIVRRISR
jgi:hypothetical protein